VRWPDGSLSDIANLTRAKDAAFVHPQGMGIACIGKRRPLESLTRPLESLTEGPWCVQNPMLGSLNLSARQRAMIDDAADEVPVAQIERYQKFIADVLRPFREIRDSSVRHAICAGLLRHGSRR
jgi:hypothetical protein